MTTVYFRRLSDEAVVPTKGTDYSAGYDLYLSEDQMVPKGGTALCSTGLSISLPNGYEGQIRSRSGLSSEGMVVANGIGTIDCDYRGEIKVLLHNRSRFDRIVKKGMRIAQLVVQQVPEIRFIELDALDETYRGGGGFGSTGML